MAANPCKPVVFPSQPFCPRRLGGGPRSLRPQPRSSGGLSAESIYLCPRHAPVVPFSFKVPQELLFLTGRAMAFNKKTTVCRPEFAEGYNMQTDHAVCTIAYMYDRLLLREVFPICLQTSGPERVPANMAVNFLEGSVTGPRRTFVTDLVPDLCNKTSWLVTHPSLHTLVTHPRHTPSLHTSDKQTGPVT